MFPPSYAFCVHKPKWRIHPQYVAVCMVGSEVHYKFPSFSLLAYYSITFIIIYFGKGIQISMEMDITWQRH